MKAPKYVLFLSVLLFSTACSKDKKGSPTNPISPEINTSQFQKNGCLDLAGLIQHVNQPGFSFPMRQVTVSLGSDRMPEQFFVYNFGVQDGTLDHFPKLKEVVQEDCQTVSMQTAYGKKINYRIEQADASSIKLVHIPDEKPPEKPEPTIRELEIHFESLNSLVLKQKATTLFTRCSATNTISYDKTVRIRWGASAASFPTTEVVDPELIKRGLKYITLTEAPAEVSENISIDELRRLQDAMKLMPLSSICGG